MNAPAAASDDETDWAVSVHGGLGSDRTEALRAMHTTTTLGMPSLAIAYRNDAGHMEAWNADPAAYQQRLTELLASS